MSSEKKLFVDGEKVLAGPLELPMMVVDCTERVGGFRYKLAFYKKDGTRDKRMDYRFFFERDLVKATL